jgi:tRNA-uridine aminocarboxypropyltransferase
MARPLCPQCRLPIARCLCEHIIASQSDVEIIVWQHPSEATHPKNSARLLAACLPQLKLIHGESISSQEFANQLDPSNRELHLLFPQEGEAQTTPSNNALEATSVRLLILDGTWRKARKLLHLNPWLEQLPRLTLQQPRPSRYHIRKAEREGQLSTLEAACAAIEQLEQHNLNSQPILNAFDQYLLKLSQFRPHR